MEDLYLYTTIAIIPLVVLTLIAGFVVQFRFAKYSKENNLSGLTGAQAARKILDEHGLFDVAIVRIEGNLTDNFNPKTNVVSLSPKVHDGNTIAAVAVAAHEVGHAIQHADSYGPLKLRTKLVPAVNVASRWMQWLILGGLLVANQLGTTLLLAGIILYSITTIFAFVTLPVEVDASRRAVLWLEGAGIVDDRTKPMVKDALHAAAYTYVVAALGSLGTLLYYIMIFMGRKD